MSNKETTPAASASHLQKMPFVPTADWTAQDEIDRLNRDGRRLAADIAALREALCAMMSHSHMLAHLHRVKKFATPDVIDFAEEDWQSARELLAGKAGQS